MHSPYPIPSHTHAAPHPRPHAWGGWSPKVGTPAGGLRLSACTRVVPGGSVTHARVLVPKLACAHAFRGVAHACMPLDARHSPSRLSHGGSPVGATCAYRVLLSSPVEPTFPCTPHPPTIISYAGMRCVGELCGGASHARCFGLSQCKGGLSWCTRHSHTHGVQAPCAPPNTAPERSQVRPSGVLALAMSGSPVPCAVLWEVGA